MLRCPDEVDLFAVLWVDLERTSTTTRGLVIASPRLLPFPAFAPRVMTAPHAMEWSCVTAEGAC
jgi:hypothetical protein